MSISQLLAYVRFVKGNAIVDGSLFCREMKERIRAKDVFNLVSAFLRENSIAWNKVGSVCTDGAPMTEHRSDFVTLTKQVALHIVSSHCLLLLLLFLSAYSRLGVATADICIFMTWHLFCGRMPFLPPTHSSEGKLGHLSST